MPVPCRFAGRLAAPAVRDPRAAELMTPLMPAIHAAFHPENSTEAAAEAITDAMNAAMMNYTPLRSLLSFPTGAVSEETLTKIIEQMNQR